MMNKAQISIRTFKTTEKGIHFLNIHNNFRQLASVTNNIVDHGNLAREVLFETVAVSPSRPVAKNDLGISDCPQRMP
jgi:hypothetical protein